MAGGPHVLADTVSEAVAEVFAGDFRQFLQAGDNFGVLGCDVVRFSDVGLEIEEHQRCRTIHIRCWLAAVAPLTLKAPISVRKVELPGSAPHGLQLLVPIIAVSLVRAFGSRLAK